jgi:hypothetical protein
VSFPELVESLRLHDVRLGLYLDVDMPGDAPEELVAALAEHKPNLLFALAREAQWRALSAQRWGPAVDDPTPGLVVGEPRRSPHDAR